MLIFYHYKYTAKILLSQGIFANINKNGSALRADPWVIGYYSKLKSTTTGMWSEMDAEA